MNNQQEDGLTKEHLRNALATEYFKVATGVNLEKELREALIQAHLNTNGELSFRHFKRAVPHIKYQDKKLNIHISVFEKFVFYFNIISSITFLILGVIYFLLLNQAHDIAWIQLLKMLSISVVLLCMSAFQFIQATPVISAKMVSQELEKQ